MRDKILNTFDRRILYVLLFVVFFLLNYFTPLQEMDYINAFNFADNKRIENLMDVFRSLGAYFMQVDGSVFPQFLEHLFVGLTGKWLFDLCNAFLMVGLVWFMSKKVVKDDTLSKSAGILSFNFSLFAILFLYPFPGQSVLGISGSLNYLLPAVLALVVMKLFKSTKEYRLGPLFLLALVAGWCQASISVPVCATLFLLFTIYKEYKSRKNAVLLTGYMLGTSLVVLSPGTLRVLTANHWQEQGGLFCFLMEHLMISLSTLFHLIVFVGAALLIVALMVRKKWGHFRSMKEWFILWGMVLLFYLASSFHQPSETLFLAIISFLIVGSYLLYLVMKQGELIINLVIMCCIVSNIAGGLFALHVTFSHHIWNKELIEAVTTSNSNHVVLPVTNVPAPSRYVHRLSLKPDMHASVNRRLSPYLQKYTIQFLEPSVYAATTAIMQPGVQDAVATKFCSKGKDLPLYYGMGLYYLKMNPELFYEGVTVEAMFPGNGAEKIPVESVVLLKSEAECYCFIPSMPEKVRVVVIRSAKNGEVIGRLVRICK